MSATDDKKPVRQRKTNKKKTASKKATNGGESKPRPKRKYVTRKTTSARKAATPVAAKAVVPAPPAVEPASGTSTTAAELSRQRIKAALSGTPRPTASETGKNGSAPAATAAPGAALRSVSAEERRRMIAERAYELAVARGFRNGNPVDDWLAAEAEIDAAILESHHEG